MRHNFVKPLFLFIFFQNNNMKYHLAISLITTVLFAMTSCKSLVTIEDVQKQNDKALSAAEEAREEAVALAEIKVQYSVDRVKAEIDELEKEQKAAKNDIKKLKGITTESAVGATSGTLKNLESRNDEIDQRIKTLKAKKPENWDESVQRIHRDIDAVKREINRIMGETKE